MNRISNHIISILLAVVFLVGCDKSGEQLTVSNDGSDRIILRFEAQADGLRTDDIIASLLKTVPLP